MITATFVSGVLMFTVHLFGGWMRKDEYGLFVTLLQVLNLMMIPALGLQTVFAQRTAAAIDENQKADLAVSTRRIFQICFLSWLVIGTCALLFKAPILETLQANAPLPIYLTILVGLPQLCLPMLLGILQGRQNFAWLGGVSIVNGAGRFLAVGVLVALLAGQAAGAIGGVLIGLSVSCVLAAWQSRENWAKTITINGQFSSNEWLKRSVPLTFGLGAGQVMLSADMIAARIILSPTESGTYGAAGMFGRGLVIFTTPLAAVMFPKMVRAVDSSKSKVLNQAIFGTISLGILCCVGCSVAAWLLPSVAGNIDVLAPKQQIISEISVLLPYFVWWMLPLALANVYVAALLARQQYKGVPLLVIVALVYAAVLFWLSAKEEPPNQTTILLTLCCFNLAFLASAKHLAKRLVS